MSFVSILYLISILFIIFFEIFRKKKRKVDMLTFINIWFAVSYFIIPVITINDRFYLNTHFKVIDITNSDYFVAYICIVLFYVTMLLSYNYAQKKHVIRVKLRSDSKKWYQISIILLTISFLGLAIYLLGYGGFDEVLKNVSQIRNGKVERNTFAAFSRMFTSYASISLFLSFSLFKTEKNNRNKIIASFIFVVSFSLAIFSAILTGGRGGLLFPLVLLYFVYVLTEDSWKIGILIFLVPLAIFIILYGKTIFANMNMGTEFLKELIVNDMISIKWYLKGFIENFTHPFYSLIVAIKVVGKSSNPIYFLNFLYTIMFFSSLLGFPYHGTISHYNTLNIIGEFDSNIPPGIIGLGYMNFFYPGIIITGLSYGFICGLIESFFDKQDDNRISIVFYLIIADSVSKFIFNGDIRVFIMQNLTLFILLIFLMSSKSIYSFKLKRYS